MGMTNEELTYQMAREQIGQWRIQLRNIQTRDGITAFAQGKAEGLAQAIREIDRILDESPTARAWREEAMR